MPPLTPGVDVPADWPFIHYDPTTDPSPPVERPRLATRLGRELRRIALEATTRTLIFAAGLVLLQQAIIAAGGHGGGLR